MIQRQSAGCWLQNQRSEMARALQEITDWPERAVAAKGNVNFLEQGCGVSLAQLERYFYKTWGARSACLVTGRTDAPSVRTVGVLRADQ